MSLKKAFTTNIFNVVDRVKEAAEHGKEIAVEKLADGRELVAEGKEKLADGKQIASTKIQKGQGIAARRRDMTKTQVLDLKDVAGELTEEVYKVSQSTMKQLQKLDRKTRRLERKIRRIEKQKMKLLRRY